MKAKALRDTIRWVLPAFLVALALPAFASGERIMLVSHGSPSNPFWGVVYNGARQAAKESGVHLQILFPNQDADQPGTTQKLAEAIATKPDGIAVTLASPAHCEYIREARAKGIPVVVYNARAAAPRPQCPYQAYIGMDEYEAGKASARRALESGRLRGRVVVGLTEPGHVGLQARAKGIAEVLKAERLHVDVMDLGNDPASIPSRLQGYVAKHKADLSGMFIPSPQGMNPILRLMKEDPQGLGRYFAASFDLTPLTVRGIEQGLIDHTVDQQPYLQGYYAVIQLALAARGRFEPADINTGMALVTASNVKPIAQLVDQKLR